MTREEVKLAAKEAGFKLLAYSKRKNDTLMLFMCPCGRMERAVTNTEITAGQIIQSMKRHLAELRHEH